MIPAILLVLAACAVALFAGRAIRSRERASVADYWARVASQMILVLAPVLLVSAALETVSPDRYFAGHHGLLDVTGAFGWPLRTCFLVALFLPLSLWLVLLGLGLRVTRVASSTPSFLSSGVGLEASRRWLLFWAVPTGIGALSLLPRLGGGPGAYPAAAWTFLVLLTVSLVGVALAPVLAGEASPEGAVEASPQSTGAASWPQALTDGGVPTQPLVRWEGRESRAPRPVGARFDHRLLEMGALRVAPELVEAVAGLLAVSGTQARENSRVIVAPDDCGQAEAVALTAQLLHRRQGTHAMVVTAGDAAALATRFARWLPVGCWTVIEGGSPLPPPETLWVVDAKTLSDAVFPRIWESKLLARLGLLVWWNVHDFSGTPAARLRALSRRLHRLLDAHGLSDVRTITLLRRAAHADAQQSAFVNGLLPLPFDAETLVEVPVEGSRAVAVHHLPATLSASHARQLALSAIRASLAGGWRTALDLGADGVAAREVLGMQPDAFAPGGSMEADAAHAAARIHLVQPGDVLALTEILSHGGRAFGDGGEAAQEVHHVGVLVSSHEPYTRYLLARIEGKGTAGLGTARRLIAPRAGQAYMRRQLLLALGELPDTRRGLLGTFFNDKELVRTTLEAIDREGNLARTEVRSLDARERLIIDHQYRTRRPAERGARTIAGASERTVEVRDPTTAEGPCWRVERERLAIEAYPHCVFAARGQRYRIAEWSAPDTVADAGWLACRREDLPYETWRRRHSAVWDLVPRGVPVTVGSGGRSFRRVVADLWFEEEVTGVVQVSARSATRSRPEVRLLDEPIGTSFPTRGLLLDFSRSVEASRDGAVEARGAVSLCEALRHVLPVHLAVADGDLELVPLWGEESAEGLYGVALVELYPGGMGVVDALEGEHDFIAQLLGWARDWLRHSRDEGSLSNVLDTPAARAAAADHLPDPVAALALLERAV